MWYDVIVVGILVFAMIRGAMKGMVWQLAVIAAIVLCFAFAESLSLSLAPLISVEPPLNRWIAMFLLYVGFSFVCFAAARVLRDFIEKARFEAFDTHLGAAFGLLKGVAFSLVLTFFVVTISESQRSTILNSYSGYASAVIMDALHPVMPAGLHDVLEPYIHRLDHPGLPLKHNHHQVAGHEDNHDHATDDAPFGGNDDAPFTADGDPQAGDSNALVAFVDGVEAIIDSDVRSLALEALQNTEPEDRGELMAKLSSSIPSLIRTISLKWRDGKPAHDDANNNQERSRLLREVSALYYDSAADQQTMIDEVEQSLAGIPDHVALAVVRDWHADVMAVRPDPDPETGLSTRLDERIVRQLELAGVPLTNLSSTLQSRLQESVSR